jgi:hypothetical protein
MMREEALNHFKLETGVIARRSWREMDDCLACFFWGSFRFSLETLSFEWWKVAD